jgi:DNA polymerase III epsilon subunit-like protein
MTLDEVNKIRELLLEHDFRELKPSEDFEVISEDYLTAKEIARKLDIKLDMQSMNEALTGFGYKQWVEGASVPSNPDNSAFIIKSIENEEDDVKEYYIQPVWQNSVVSELDDFIASNEDFRKQKVEVIRKNKKIKNQKLKFFSSNADFVALYVKKTGFHIKKDFIVSIGFAVVEDNQVVKTGEMLVNDDLDEEKTERYLHVDDIYEKSPFNFIKIKLPTMENCSYSSKFVSRRNVLRLVYKLIRNKDVVWHNADNSAPFLQKLFENEGNIPLRHCYNEIIGEEVCLREAFEWLEPKESDRLFDISNRHSVKRREKGALADALLIANISLYLRKKLDTFKKNKEKVIK